MPRTRDKPGTWRVLERGDRYVLSGVDQSGERVKLRFRTRDEANRTAGKLFDTSAVGIGPIQGPPDTSPATPSVDDWGIPIRVSPDLAASVASSFGLPAPGTSPTAPVTGEIPVSAKEDAEKKARRAKHAKSLMEMAGMGWAAGTVALSKRFVNSTGKEPVNANPKQVNDLADCTKETFVEWFGDREVQPWQMMILLTFGIPMAMWLQSPKRKEAAEPSKLKSVP